LREELLAQDVVLRGDGRGKAPAITRPIHGRTKVARTLTTGLRTATRVVGLPSVERRSMVNAVRCFFDRDDRVAGVMMLDVAGCQIQTVSSIVNPDKLQHLGLVSDLRALLGKWH
jgi:hypothetical protein